MVSRSATNGRGVAVRPTERAAADLRVLRAAWAKQLAVILGDDLDTVRKCTRLLSHLEQRLTADDQGGP